MEFRRSLMLLAFPLVTSVAEAGKLSDLTNECIEKRDHSQTPNFAAKVTCNLSYTKVEKLSGQRTFRNEGTLTSQLNLKGMNTSQSVNSYESGSQVLECPVFQTVEVRGPGRGITVNLGKQCEELTEARVAEICEERTRELCEEQFEAPAQQQQQQQQDQGEQCTRQVISTHNFCEDYGQVVRVEQSQAQH